MPSAKSKQKTETHEAILQSAARLLRSRGIEGASVAEVMKGAGLTVGGFYAHFGTKDAMVSEALRQTGKAVRAVLFGKLEEVALPGRSEQILQRYLSREHRDRVEQGCPMPAVVGDVATRQSALQQEVASEVELYAKELQAHLPRSASARRAALATFALMYGGLTLARAVGTGALSDEILLACRDFARAALGGSR
jgi:TetR/AcrR family transcriptional repressor of nem operon